MGQVFEKDKLLNKDKDVKTLPLELYDPENLTCSIIDAELKKIFVKRKFGEYDESFVKDYIIKQKIYYDFLKNGGCPKDRPADVSELDVELWKLITRNIVCKEINGTQMFRIWNQDTQNLIEE